MNINEFTENNKDFNIQKLIKIKNPVVYLICKGINEEIIYIGSTTDLYGRISMHMKRVEFKNCSIYYFPCHKNKYQQIERILINTIKTKYNKHPLENNIKDGLKLNTNKIRLEMNRINMTKGDLAKALGYTPAMVTYLFKYRPVSYANKLALIFKIEPKDLIR